MPRRKEFRQFVHLDDPVPAEICYLLHLDPPYIPQGAEADPFKWAGHYLGTSDDFSRRGIEKHGTANGPRILQVQREAGGSWHLVRTWQGGRAKEKQLKTHAGKHYCPEPQCAGDHAIPADNPPRQGAKYLSRKQRRMRQAVREAQANYPAPQLRQDAGLSHAEAQALLAGPESAPEPMSPEEELRRIEHLEASWRIPHRQPVPKVRDLELDRMNAKDATAMARQAWRQPVKSIPAANQKMLGQQVAEQTIIAQADAGMPAERIAHQQDATCIHLLSEATTPEGQRFAKEYDHTARILVRELQEMEAGQ